MKKNKSLLILCAVVAFFCFMSNSCNTDNQSKIAEPVKLENYGFYHNEALILYKQSSYYSKAKLKSKSYNQIMEEMLKLMKGKYPAIYGKVDLKIVTPYFAEYSSAASYSFEHQWLKIKDNFILQGKLSLETVTVINSILANKDNYTTIIQKINLLKQRKNLLENDKKFITVFTSVLNASNKFWINTNSNATFNKTNYCNHQMIIADAAASGCFLWTGPVAGIVGAAASLVAASTGDCA